MPKWSLHDWFSMSKWVSKSKFLLDSDSWATKLLRITNIIYFQSPLNPVHDFEICPISGYATLEFANFVKTLIQVNLDWVQMINWCFLDLNETFSNNLNWFRSELKDLATYITNSTLPWSIEEGFEFFTKRDQNFDWFGLYLS